VKHQASSFNSSNRSSNRSLLSLDSSDEALPSVGNGNVVSNAPPSSSSTLTYVNNINARSHLPPRPKSSAEYVHPSNRPSNRPSYKTLGSGSSLDSLSSAHSSKSQEQQQQQQQQQRPRTADSPSLPKKIGKKQQMAMMTRLASSGKNNSTSSKRVELEEAVAAHDDKIKGRQMVIPKIDLDAALERKQRQAQYSRHVDGTHQSELSLKVNSISQAVSQQFCTLMSTERCSLLLMDHTKNELYFKPTGGLDIYVEEIRFSATTGIAGHCSTHKDIINVQDPYSDERFNNEIDKATHFKIRSILCLPVISTRDGSLLAVC
jgi:hypothetical protein